jgi:peptidoglycan/xylan/chitin deacetylase (PgdA/CDA1 family)
MAGPYRIAVFTGDPSYTVRKGIVDIDSAIPGLQWLVVWHAPKKTVPQLLRSQRNNLRRNGWRWIPYQAADLLHRLWPRRVPALAGPAPGDEYTLSALQQRANLRLLRVADIHGESALAEVKAFAPDLGLSLAAPILRRPLFSIPRLGTVNLHKGKVPQFRGMPPAFWEFWTGAPSVGCTVHFVDDKLDTGRVVAEAELPRPRHATVRGMQLMLDELGAGLMRDAAADLLAGQAVPRAQPPHDAPAYRKPTLAQVAEMQRREARASGMGAPWRHRAKDLVLGAADLAMRLGGRAAVAPRVTVLLYHRVSDEVRDNLTVGVAQFERHMALLRQHCRVVSIEDVVDMQAVPRTDRPLVAVTFDDGYLDNFTHAVPILRRHGIPAAFFVSTGIVASDLPFPHDVRRGNDPIPVMQWDQLRDMQRWGFTIGSHTVHHIDCAAEPADRVRAELASSRDDLQRELGARDRMFAYPFGGRQHMTAERLALVREAGYAACLSAYGGSNIGTVDRFNVLRRGVHWEFSDQALLYRCLGL